MHTVCCCLSAAEETGSTVMGATDLTTRYAFKASNESGTKVRARPGGVGLFSVTAPPPPNRKETCDVC
jgi:hypothetical protein